MRFGTASILGRPNVGKTTLLNRALGEELAVVSPVPQTTRDTLLGVVHRPRAQIAFLDTPGVHRPRSELGRRMNAAALGAARSGDVIVLMTDVSPLLHRASTKTARTTAPSEAPERMLPEDRSLCQLVAAESRERLLVINKVDLLKNKGLLLPYIQAFVEACQPSEVLPVSLHDPTDVERVLGAIESKLPEGPPGYDEETLTTAPTNFFIREYIREQVLHGAQSEVPHAVAVEIDRIDQDGDRMLIQATLHVDKPGQRKILVGRGGSKIREIGTLARQRIEALVGGRVRLELFVRVSPRWRDTARQLAELGYEPAEDSLLPDEFERASSSRGRTS